MKISNMTWLYNKFDLTNLYYALLMRTVAVINTNSVKEKYKSKKTQTLMLSISPPATQRILIDFAEKKIWHGGLIISFIESSLLLILNDIKLITVRTT